MKFRNTRFSFRKKLEQILRDNRGEVRSMLLTQYDEQAHIEYEKELSFEEGKI